MDESLEDVIEIDAEELKMWNELVYQEMFTLDSIDPQGTLFRYFKKRGADCCGYSMNENIQRIKDKRSHLLITDEAERRKRRDDPIILTIDEKQFRSKRSNLESEESDLEYSY